MRTRIVQIGNSRGIRIPKVLLDQTGLGDEVELEVRADEIVIRAASRPRAGWAEAFAAAGGEPDDDALTEWESLENEADDEEWTW